MKHVTTITEESREINITDKTKIGLYAVLASLPIFVGGVFWLSMIYFKAEAAEQINIKQDQKIDAQMDLLLDIRDRLKTIETTLDLRAKHKQEGK